MTKYKLWIAAHLHGNPSEWANESAPGHIIWQHVYFEHGYAYRRDDGSTMIVKSVVFGACLICQETHLEVDRKEYHGSDTSADL